jgi:hypothetical protein
MFDFLFEFIDGEWEGEQILCEEPTLADAWETLCGQYGFERKELRFIERMSIEEGEMLGLDTY